MRMTNWIRRSGLFLFFAGFIALLAYYKAKDRPLHDCYQRCQAEMRGEKP